MEYDDVDVYAREVTTTSREAQLWFNRGLVWCYAYFHDDAVACFRNVLSADPSCAMAFWGIAYATGPNYNMPWELRDENMRRDSLAAAYDATQAALALARHQHGRQEANPWRSGMFMAHSPFFVLRTESYLPASDSAVTPV